MSYSDEHTVSMDAIAGRVKAAGYAAYVEHTGGGCQTIYAYRCPVVPDYPRLEAQPDVQAGPGSLNAAGFALAYLGDFYIGRTSIDAATMEWGDDDYATDTYTGVVGDTEETLANKIVGQLQAATEQFGKRRIPCSALRDVYEVPPCPHAAELLAVVADDPGFEKRAVCQEHAHEFVADTFNLKLELQPL